MQTFTPSTEPVALTLSGVGPLDEVGRLVHEDDPAAQLALLRSGQVDLVEFVRPSDAAAVLKKKWTQSTRDFIEAAARLPGAGGAYLNFSGDAPTDSAAVRAQFGANLERLKEVKRKYDPSNAFRVNNNIRP